MKYVKEESWQCTCTLNVVRIVCLESHYDYTQSKFDCFLPMSRHSWMWHATWWMNDDGNDNDGAKSDFPFRTKYSADYYNLSFGTRLFATFTISLAEVNEYTIKSGFHHHPLTLVSDMFACVRPTKHVPHPVCTYAALTLSQAHHYLSAAANFRSFSAATAADDGAKAIHCYHYIAIVCAVRAVFVFNFHREKPNFST